MSNRGFGVRLFEMQPDGTLEPFLGVDEDYFAGAVPNVGDTFAKWGLNDVYTFFSVQRRLFIDSPNADNGWCVIVRSIESAPQLETVVNAWAEDTKFWADVDEHERVEKGERLAESLRKLTTKKKPAPNPPATPKAKKTLKKMLKPRPAKKPGDNQT
ncbi:hypothetical protein GUK30_14075 [Rhizobium leguminosarum]|uniref:hypothetical protein n=1 Tax=Rhizobium ruizarguesonis TaxID=2081791 RepID=UPI0013C28D2C|nr:hypothetical protein [Rhizobium ruizarguesonis]NEI20537.1 hypothetical protein [Rhizobium ruizarguesonis]